MKTLEKTHLKLGFIALTDCGALVAAKELGLFEQEGLSVTLSREASWANIRDKVAAGALDGAHMLAPMALACSLGVSGPLTPMIAPLSLNANGSSITVSKALAEDLRRLDQQGMAERPRTAKPFKTLIDARAKAGLPPLTFAVVFPFSVHAYLIRFWLAEAGIDPDRDVRLTVVPPARMAARMNAGDVDCFCVGAPWGDQVEADGAGEMLVHASEIWPSGVDKVLGVTAAWAEENPETLQAMLRALLKAGAWADEAANREILAGWLAGAAYLDTALEVVRRGLLPESFRGLLFHHEDASFPWRSHAVWLLGQMKRWGQARADLDLAALADQVYRPDLYRKAAGAIGQTAPRSDSRLETSGSMFSTRRFDPVAIDDYLAGFAIRRAPAPVE
jgi:ABC-type nitrate/sulfonate/bicarbonate transport system substrate-binding protein